tara:strand:+ start:449 stop:1072 length:624 start_codon:yes stop_codon:yes gene_type:complete
MEPCYAQNYLECGIDEAGRGPLFGRVYSASVVLPKENFDFSIIKDSKKYSSEQKLLEAYNYVIENCIDYGIGYCSEEEIDKVNIRNATHMAMHRAINNMTLYPEHILVDGNSFETYIRDECIIPHTCIKKGDNTYSNIAAASIIAKVTRDRYIKDMCNKYPNLDEYYGILSNKGYGTKKHCEGLKTYGTTQWHRQTFNKCRQCILEN